MNNGYDRQVYRMCINNYCPIGVENPTDAEVILEMHKKIEELTLKIREAEKADELGDKPTTLTIGGKEYPVRIIKYTVDGGGTRKRYEVELLSECTDDIREIAKEIQKKIERAILYGSITSE